jgi:hypothetical protein
MTINPADTYIINPACPASLINPVFYTIGASFINVLGGLQVKSKCKLIKLKVFSQKVWIKSLKDLKR